MSALIRRFDELIHEHAAEVGGKGLNLGLMTTAGFPVPPGFVVTVAAYRASGEHEAASIDDNLRQQLKLAYDRLGACPVAVRSSASDEDGAELSFAGQQETILGVQGFDALCDAIVRCWKSLHTERAAAYRAAQKVDSGRLGMAVVVQHLVAADVAGVLFTTDPHDPTGEHMLVEAAWGLGEAVVSGRVTPDRFQVRRTTGEAARAEISTKRERLDSTGWHVVEAPLQAEPCLAPTHLKSLCEIAQRIEAYYGGPRDVEWAFANGQLFILQARPITTAGAAELEQVRRREIERVGAMAEGRSVAWGRYNLAEVLPKPTPMTWSIVRRFMSSRGGFGRMFRSLGYDPDPQLDEDGFLDLIAGRPYVNLEREPKLFFRDFPYGYDLETIRNDPRLGIYPQLETIAAKKTSRFWWRLPAIAWNMLVSTSRIRAALESEAGQLTSKIYPQFAALVREDRARNLQSLDDRLLSDRLQFWLRAIDDFAEHSLRPGVLAATALAELERLLALAKVADPSATARHLLSGVAPPAECDLAGALRRLSMGEMTRAAFLADFGHRGPEEMELAKPRWSEVPHNLSTDVVPSSAAHGAETPHQTLDITTLTSDSSLRRQLEKALHQARMYLGLREASKHYLMLGFERIRAHLREIGRRLGLGDDIFFLALDDLPTELRAVAIERLRAKASANERERKLLLTLNVPPVIFSDELDVIGGPLEIASADEWQATALSFGSFEGPALVLEEPIPAEEVAPGFVLVCPSTDPAWVPLFIKAGALVMESGGVLSHGAIVARELNIPAVAGVPNVHRRLRTGQRLAVDGTAGRVHVLADANP